jgi:hypothetical protein
LLSPPNLIRLPQQNLGKKFLYEHHSRGKWE